MRGDSEDSMGRIQHGCMADVRKRRERELVRETAREEDPRPNSPSSRADLRASHAPNISFPFRTRATQAEATNNLAESWYCLT